MAERSRRELTLRSAVVGVAIGVVLTCGNLYLGLKTGLWDAGWVTAAMLGFAILAPIGRLSGRAFTPTENNLVQSVASSTAAMPSTMGLLGAIPALELAGWRPHPLALVAWAVVLGLLGIWLALPLRAQLVEREALPFPTGRAAAEAIGAAHAEAGSARRRAWLLLAGALVAVAITLARDWLHWVPGLVGFGAAAAMQIGFAVNPMLLGGGVLVGGRTGLELLAGSLLAWLVVGPHAAARGFIAGDYGAMSSWLLWPGVAAMSVAGLIALGMEWRLLSSFGKDLATLGRGRAVGLGLAIAVAVVAVAWLALDTPPLAAAVGVIFAVLFNGVFVRAYAQTDMAHYAALGQLGQATIGALAPGREAANIIGGSIAAGSAPQTVNVMTCFKIGALVGGRPGPIIGAHVLGVVAGALISAPAYAALASAYGLGSPELPAPFAASWRALGAVAEHGLAALPPGAGTAAAIAAAIAALLTLAKRGSRFVPSPLVIGLGFLVPVSVTATIFLGALIGHLVAWRAPTRVENELVPAAAGVIAGESIAGVAIALLIVAGILS